MSRALRTPPRLYSIPTGVSFVDGLARGLLRRYGSDPQSLARLTVLVPTKRGIRSLSEAFLRLTNGRPMILPSMQALGDVDEDEFLFNPAAVAADLTLPPAASPVWRQLTLTTLVQAFEARHGATHTSPAQAVVLANALGRFLSDVDTEGLDFAGLADLAKDYANHWQETLDFLEIVTTQWPHVLADKKVMDAVPRRNALLRGLADLWRTVPPPGPVIAAGSTGSVPATAALLSVIARLPDSGVVLPGFDRHMDADSWDAVDATHPQATMKDLLQTIGATREDVVDWLTADELPVMQRGPTERVRLLTEALRPAATTDQWRGMTFDGSMVFDGFTRIDAPSPREEAGAIALIMRGVLETPEKTAALVTPDRALARRVKADLDRWGIAIDDSAGMPLGETPPGVFLLLVAEMITENFAPIPLLACFKHPFASAGQDPIEFRKMVRLLEREILRGPRPSADLRVDLLRIKHERTRERLIVWWDAIMAQAAPFIDLMDKPVALSDLAMIHIGLVERLAARPDKSADDVLWRGDAGEALSRFVEEMIDDGKDFMVRGQDYAALFKTLMQHRVVRPRYGRHPRLRILGPLEARLQQDDVVILGGLNEGSWPPDPGVDPWLSRPMRAAFGLPPLERRIGLSAHDFIEAASAPVVVLTRAAKVDGAPTVPSRWLTRLDAVLQGADIPHHPALRWYQAMDHVAQVTPIAPPAPCPPVDVRPRKLSVTRIQAWMRDPYEIYAQYILKLRPLDPIDAPASAADKGTIIHDALDRFVRAYPHQLPDDAFEKLVEIGADVFKDIIDKPTVRAFWWPRFVHVAEWFVQNERDRRADYKTVGSECSGTLEIDSVLPFTLTAKADRIDQGPDGSLVIIDYKTGQAPENRQLAAGYAPQLPLEAVMAMAGAFDNVKAAPVTGLEFWRLHGGEPPADVKQAKEIDDLILKARRGLYDLIARFDKPTTPYLSAPRPDQVTGGDYDHLARIKEWSGVGSLAAADHNERTTVQPPDGGDA